MSQLSLAQLSLAQLSLAQLPLAQLPLAQLPLAQLPLALTKGCAHPHRPPGRGLAASAARAPVVVASQQTTGSSSSAWGIAAWEGANPDLAGESPAARLQRRMDNGAGDGESTPTDRGQSVAAGRQPGPEG